MSFPTTPRNAESCPNCKDKHPMVLVLIRGGYCPKDRRQAEGLVQHHRELEVANYRLVTISTDNITETNEYRSGVGQRLLIGVCPPVV
jgi:peroxiredoxin